MMKTSSWRPQQALELLKLNQPLVLAVKQGETLQLPALSVIHLSLKLLRVGKEFTVRTMEGVIVYEADAKGNARGWDDFGNALGAYDYLMQAERKQVIEELLTMQAAGTLPLPQVPPKDGSNDG